MNEPIVISIKNPYLAQIAYVVGNPETKTCVVIDPPLDIKRVEVEWEGRGWTLVGILMTHLHADHVSGDIMISNKYNVQIISNYHKGVEIDKDGFKIDDFDISILETPGHSKDSVCYEIGNCLFTGDTLLVGSCGRPDLGVVTSEEFTEQCRELFQSLKGIKKLLHPDLIIYPGHGAGSLCGSGIGGDDSSTLRQELLTNPALQFDDEDKFVDWISSEIPFRPLYFDRVKKINAGTFDYPETIISDAVYVQVYDDFVIGYNKTVNNDVSIAHSIWIGRGMKFETWLVALVDTFFYVQFRENGHDPLEVIQRKKSNLANRIASVGMSHLFLDFVNIVGNEVVEMAAYSGQEYDLLIDVRTNADVRKNGKKFKHALHVPIDQLGYWTIAEDEINHYKHFRIAVHCNGGYLSQIGQSILLDAGFKTIWNVKDLNLITRP